MQPALETWLVRRAASRRRTQLAIAIAGMTLGMGITFLTFWFIYALVWWVALGLASITQNFFGTSIRITRSWRFAIAGGFLALLIADVLRRPRPEPEHYAGQRYSPSFGAGGLFGAFAQLLRYPQASSTMIVSLLQTGPRLFLGSGSWFLETFRTRVDWNVCLPLLDMMVANPRALLWEELSSAFPNIDRESARRQLHSVEGVVFLEKGLALSADFRQELFQAMQ